MGPLAGVRIVELAGIGPAPFGAMLLSDLGADVLRIDRTADSGLGIPLDPAFEVLNRGRRSVAIDLKHPRGPETVLRLVEVADALLEGFRPGVAERLGIGPGPCLERNPRLVYGRMTGWGQDGPLAHTAGHDINYIALSGALHAIGRDGGAPVPPLNLVGDFGGGGMVLALGVTAALFEARESGKGQVVDAAMVEGAASLMAMMYGFFAGGQWRDERGGNIIDTGAPYYDTYETADGRFVAVGAIEAKFYAALLDGLGLAAKDLPDQNDRAGWPVLRQAIAARFRAKTRDEWCEVFEGTDACFAPVLSLAEAPAHAHNRARGVFTEFEGVVQPAPVPRFERTPGRIQGPPPVPGEHTRAALADWGVPEAEIAGLIEAGAIAQIEAPPDRAPAAAE
jgi:alpha-methylacyl-CoA racemase